MKIQFDIPPSSGQESNGLAVRYAAAKRQVPRWRWYLLLAMVLTPPAYLLIRFGVAYWWETAPAQVIVEQTTLRAPTAGRVVRVVHAGDAVELGQTLMELAPHEPEPGVTSAPATPAAVAAPTAPPPSLRQNMLDEAERIAQHQLAIQQERLRTMQALREQDAATRHELEVARVQELQALADVNRARLDAREHRASVAWELATARAHAAPSPAPTPLPAPSAEQIQPLPPLTAPFKGTVLRSLVRPGEWVAVGADIAILQGQSEPIVQAYLPAEKARYAQVGREGTMRFMDGGRMRAKVVGVVTEAQNTPADRVSPLAPRTPSIVVRLQALEPLPPAYRIHHLPLDVRFDWIPGAWF